MWIIKAARQGFIIEQMIQERSRTAHGSREKAKKKKIHLQASTLRIINLFGRAGLDRLTSLVGRLWSTFLGTSGNNKQRPLPQALTGVTSFCGWMHARFRASAGSSMRKARSDAVIGPGPLFPDLLTCYRQVAVIELISLFFRFLGNSPAG
jgi:hypothetical protein